MSSNNFRSDFRNRKLLSRHLLILLPKRCINISSFKLKSNTKIKLTYFKSKKISRHRFSVLFTTARKTLLEMTPEENTQPI